MDSQSKDSKSYKDTLYTVDKKGNRKWVYAAVVKGKFFFKRRIVAWLLLALYLLTPWFDVRGKQAVFLDIFNRKFVFFGETLWATDTIFLFLFLFLMAILLFFFTALLGRIWCGWACPETIFLEFLFKPIERLIEGSHIKQRKLDQAPWSFEKIWKKLLKHSINAFLAWCIASTFIAYFVGHDAYLNMITSSPSENMGLFVFMLIMLGLMGFQFGWFREQFCTVLCPYARFQSVLLDHHSMIVAYDYNRGEPRAKIKRGESSEGKGDCIECNKCVTVCPTGIDIRNGLQLECVNCTACIDACDDIMLKVNRKDGLIRYASEAELENKKTKYIRGRTVFYGALIIAILSVFSFLLVNRELSDAQLLRNIKTTPFSMVNDDIVLNSVRLKISNKSEIDTVYEIQILDSAAIDIIFPQAKLEVLHGEINVFVGFIKFDKKLLSKGKHRIKIKIKSIKTGYVYNQEFTLLGPGG